METKTYGTWTKLTDGAPPPGVLSLRIDGVPTAGVMREHIIEQPFIMEIPGNVYNTEEFHRIEWLDEKEGILISKERLEALEKCALLVKIIAAGDLSNIDINNVAKKTIEELKQTENAI